MFKKGIALLAMLSLLAVGGCGKKAETAPVAAEATPVKVAQVNKGQLASTVKISGKVKASEEVSIVPKMGGKVTQVLVDVGQRVKKGDLLVALDDKDIQAQIKLYQAMLGVTEAGQKQAEIAYKEAKDNLDRMKYLYDQGAISEQQWEQVQNGYDRAAAAYTPNSSNTQTAAQIQQAKAQLEAAQVNLSNTKITAPIDGVIGSRSIEVGEMAGPTMPILSIVNNDQMVVEGSLAESEVNLVKVGDKVQVFVSAASDKPFEGIVESVAPSADPMTKAYPIKVKIANDSQLLKSGMMAEMHLTSQAKQDIIVITKDAVLDRGSSKVVYVVNGDKAEERTVTIGLTTDNQIEITSGLNAGDKLVISGQQLLNNGAKVSIQTGDNV